MQYNGRDIHNIESDLDVRISDLVTLIRISYNGIVMDFANVARYFTLDLLSTIAFGGRPFGFMAENGDKWGYNKFSAQFMPMFVLLAHHAGFRKMLSLGKIAELTAPRHTDKGGMGPPLAFAHEAVSERYRPDAKHRNDMLGHFVSKGMSQKQCEAEAFLQIIAGSDATTTILRSMLYLLVATPATYARLQAEVDDADNRQLAKYSEIQTLPYLSACVWEGIRMYPPLSGLKPKVAPPGGDTIKGRFFPEGTEVATNDESFCRSKVIFGQDADLFRPERWINADSAAKVKYRQTVDTVFGVGRYQCLGRHIAMMELHKTLFEVRRTISITLLNMN